MDSNLFTQAEILKRSPAKKADGIIVDQRCYAVGRGQDEKHTFGLMTCIRVAIIGHYNDANIGYDRFLAHVDDWEEPPLEAFSAEVEAAKRNGLTDLEAHIVAPRPGPDDDAADVEGRRDQIYQIVEALTGSSAKVVLHLHDDEASWKLVIHADKKCIAEEE